MKRRGMNARRRLETARTARLAGRLRPLPNPAQARFRIVARRARRGTIPPRGLREAASERVGEGTVPSSKRFRPARRGANLSAKHDAKLETNFDANFDANLDARLGVVRARLAWARSASETSRSARRGEVEAGEATARFAAAPRGATAQSSPTFEPPSSARRARRRGTETQGRRWTEPTLQLSGRRGGGFASDAAIRGRGSSRGGAEKRLLDGARRTDLERARFVATPLRGGDAARTRRGARLVDEGRRRAVDPVNARIRTSRAFSPPESSNAGSRGDFPGRSERRRARVLPESARRFDATASPETTRKLASPVSRSVRDRSSVGAGCDLGASLPPRLLPLAATRKRVFEFSDVATRAPLSALFDVSRGRGGAGAFPADAASARATFAIRTQRARASQRAAELEAKSAAASVDVASPAFLASSASSEGWGGEGADSSGRLGDGERAPASSAPASTSPRFRFREPGALGRAASTSRGSGGESRARFESPSSPGGSPGAGAGAFGDATRRPAGEANREASIEALLRECRDALNLIVRNQGRDLTLDA